jgi:hypothetical protein
MYQSALTSHELTKGRIISLYRGKLLSLGNKVMAEHRYGIKSKIDRIAFLKAKNLLPVLTADVVTIPYSDFFEAINNK